MNFYGQLCPSVAPSENPGEILVAPDMMSSAVWSQATFQLSIHEEAGWVDVSGPVRSTTEEA